MISESIRILCFDGRPCIKGMCEDACIGCKRPDGAVATPSVRARDALTGLGSRIEPEVFDTMSIVKTPKALRIKPYRPIRGSLFNRQ